MHLSVYSKEEYEKVTSFKLKGYAGQSTVWEHDVCDDDHPWTKGQWIEVDENKRV